MLNLQSDSRPRWLMQVDEHLDEILVDHAHCERKAAGTALNLLFSYVENEALCRQMTLIVNEELEHFQQVLDLLKQRNIPFRRLKPARYAGQLKELVRKHEPQRAVDRLLIASLIEARSCERFDLLRRHVTDPPLAQFYDSLFESEARHHRTYVKLAEDYEPRAVVHARLQELAQAEAAIIDQGDSLPRMHS